WPVRTARARGAAPAVRTMRVSELVDQSGLPAPALADDRRDLPVAAIRSDRAALQRGELLAASHESRHRSPQSEAAALLTGEPIARRRARRRVDSREVEPALQERRGRAGRERLRRHGAAQELVQNPPPPPL